MLNLISISEYLIKQLLNHEFAGLHIYNSNYLRDIPRYTKSFEILLNKLCY